MWYCLLAGLSRIDVVIPCTMRAVQQATVAVATVQTAMQHHRLIHAMHQKVVVLAVDAVVNDIVVARLVCRIIYAGRPPGRPSKN